MSEKVSNRQIIERIAKEVLQMETKEEIDAVVNQFIYNYLALS